MASEEWQDWDDIGSLFGDEAQSQSTPSVDYQQTVSDMIRTFTGEHSMVLSPAAAAVLRMDNYGLGSTPSAYSDLTSLSRVLFEQLQGYYSPERVQTEEFEYCVFSWVALQSVQAFLEPKELSEAMECTNTCQRMEQVYDAMMCHKEALQQLIEAKIEELQDCGEECTDLF